jgi:hypothetical protein
MERVTTDSIVSPRWIASEFVSQARAVGRLLGHSPFSVRQQSHDHGAGQAFGDDHVVLQRLAAGEQRDDLFHGRAGWNGVLAGFQIELFRAGQKIEYANDGSKLKVVIDRASFLKGRGGALHISALGDDHDAGAAVGGRRPLFSVEILAIEPGAGHGDGEQQEKGAEKLSHGRLHFSGRLVRRFQH